MRLGQLWRPAALLVIFLSLSCDSAQAFSPRCGADRPVLRNGYYVQEDGYKVVRAECYRGFQLIGGDARRFCTPTMGYSGGEPSCQDVDECSLLAEWAENPESSADGPIPDEVVERGACHQNATCHNRIGSYECQCNHGLYGDGRTCKPLECSFPKVQNAEVTPGFQGDSLTFNCHHLHGLYGAQRIRCDHSSGQWKPDPPRCIAYPKCPEPVVMDHGEIYFRSDTDYLRGAAVRLRCKDGYTLEGSDLWHCDDCVHSYCSWKNQETTYCRQTGVKQMGNALVRKLDKAALNSRSTPEFQSAYARSVAPFHPVGVNIIFLMDESSSMTNRDFKRGVEFFKMIVRELHSIETHDHNSSGITKFGAFTFAEKPTEHFWFDKTENKTAEEIVAMLDNIKPKGGSTDLGNALQSLPRKLLRTGYLPNAKNLPMIIVFVLSDGETDTTALVRTSDGLRNKYKADIFALGVGPFARKDQLELIVSEPKIEHLFMLDNFSDLNKLKGYIIDTRNVSEKCGHQGSPPMGAAFGAAAQNDWPWTAIIVNSFDVRVKYCGATLICRKWLVTSAQCIYDARNSPASIEVKLGMYRYTDNARTRPTVNVIEGVKSVRIHPNYDNSIESIRHLHDLALIELSQKVALNRAVRTACLPDSNNLDVLSGQPWMRDYVYLLGWGISENSKTLTDSDTRLKHEKNKFTSLANCGGMMDLPSVNIPVEYRGNLSCVNSRPQTMFSDVGGALMWNNDDTYYLVGVPTHNSLSANNEAVVVTKLKAYLAWINEQTGNCNQAHRKTSV